MRIRDCIVDCVCLDIASQEKRRRKKKKKKEKEERMGVLEGWMEEEEYM